MPPSRRQILRRRRVAVFGAAAIVLGTVFYLPLTLLAPLGSVEAAVAPVEVAAQPAAVLEWPTLGTSAVGAIGYDGLLGAGGTLETGSGHGLGLCAAGGVGPGKIISASRVQESVEIISW